MRNVSNFLHCYGCGVCAVACPKHAISIQLNQDGFLSPFVNDLCIDCGICLEVCSFNHQEVCSPVDLTESKSVAAWSKDTGIRYQCTSGGVAYEIENFLLNAGYNVLAVRYDKKSRTAEHYIATKQDDLQTSIGSKYIQSHTVGAFSQLSKGKKYLIVGTPCQIDSLRRYIRKRKWEDDFILMDFFCHSVPSWLMWNRYLDMVGIKEYETVQFRCKKKGWQNSTTVYVKGDNREWISSLSEGDLFYWFFLGDRCPNRACVNDCKYKQKSSAADIRIGDLWGYKYIDNQQGVSALVGFTKKGLQIIDSLDKCIKEPCAFETVAELQMKRNATPKKSYPFVLYALRKGWHLRIIRNVAFLIEFPTWMISQLKYYYRRIIQLLRHKD